MLTVHKSLHIKWWTKRMRTRLDIVECDLLCVRIWIMKIYTHVEWALVDKCIVTVLSLYATCYLSITINGHKQTKNDRKKSRKKIEFENLLLVVYYHFLLSCSTMCSTVFVCLYTWFSIFSYTDYIVLLIVSWHNIKRLTDVYVHCYIM